LLSDSELNEEQKDFVCTIQSCGKSLLNIINDILDYSSIETGNLSTHLSSFDVHKMIDNTAKLFSASALKKKVDIKLKIEPVQKHEF
jgi:signal transduction histidine kinase